MHNRCLLYTAAAERGMLESTYEAVCEDFVKINMTGGCVAVAAVTAAGKLAANMPNVLTSQIAKLSQV